MLRVGSKFSDLGFFTVRNDDTCLVDFKKLACNSLNDNFLVVICNVDMVVSGIGLLIFGVAVFGFPIIKVGGCVTSFVIFVLFSLHSSIFFSNLHSFIA